MSGCGPPLFTASQTSSAETGNPESLDYSHQPALPPDDNTNAEWHDMIGRGAEDDYAKRKRRRAESFAMTITVVAIGFRLA